MKAILFRFAAVLISLVIVALLGELALRLFAPRLGVSYTPNAKTVVRAGYGIFYEHTNGNEGNSESLEGSAPLVLTSQQFNVTGFNNIGAGGGVLFPLSFNQIPTKAIWPWAVR